ncbi:MAG: sugar phosphate isomerase/epimerase family protein [bacterium]
MRLGISAFINQNNNEFLKEYSGCNLQIAFYKKSDFDFARKNHLAEKLKNWRVKVISAHLPVDLDFKNLDEIRDFTVAIHQEFLEDNAVLTLHPKRKIDLDYSVFNLMLENLPTNLTIAIENFPHKRKKSLRTPLNIVEVCTKYNHFSMTLDLAHLQYHNLWLDDKILPHLLRHTSIIHLSNRSGGKTHIPIKEGNINIEKFLKSLKMNKWKGDIFLEYGINWKDKLLRDLKWVEAFIKSKGLCFASG